MHLDVGCFTGSACSTGTLIDGFGNADDIVKASMKFDFKGDFYWDWEYVFVYVDDVPKGVCHDYRSVLPNTVNRNCKTNPPDFFQPCGYLDVLDNMKRNNGSLSIDLYASSGLTAICSDADFNEGKLYAFRIRILMTIICKFEATPTGCVSGPPTTTLAPSSTASVLPTVLSPHGASVKIVTAYMDSGNADALFEIKNGNLIATATLDVDFRGNHGDTATESGELYFNEQYIKRCISQEADCFDNYESCGTFDVTTELQNGSLLVEFYDNSFYIDAICTDPDLPWPFAYQVQYTLTFTCTSGYATANGCFS